MTWLAADAIGLPIDVVALPLVASYVTCMYFRACDDDHSIDHAIASGLAEREDADRGAEGN